jgi:hypothetical protein
LVRFGKFLKYKIERDTALANSKRSSEKMIGVIASIFLLSFAIIATTQGRNQLAFAQGGERIR